MSALRRTVSDKAKMAKVLLREMPLERVGEKKPEGKSAREVAKEALAS